MNLSLKNYLESLTWDEVSEERKSQLDRLAEVIKKQMTSTGFSKVNFICTHNSRRSTLAQVLCDGFANLMDIPNLTFYSGGTESTAFNHRMVKALRAKNFDLQQIEKGDNPKYILKGVAKESTIYFSKKYDHDANPKKDFIAVMVCDHAAENCPVVFGADESVPLTYVDPKNADDTENESEVYLKKIDEVGAEVKYLMNRVRTST